MGYIDPGHGLKGKQKQLSTQDDLADMYDCVSTTNEIVLLCFVEKTKKAPTSKKSTDGKDTTGTKKNIAAKITEVEEMVKKLKDKHGSKYSIEQLNAWAHLIHVEKHDSCDHPPDLPYFRHSGVKKRKVDEEPDPEPKSLPVPSIATATERVSLRSECIDQLDKWHALLTKGAISQSHYAEIQALIMKDIH